MKTLLIDQTRTKAPNMRKLQAAGWDVVEFETAGTDMHSLELLIYQLAETKHVTMPPDWQAHRLARVAYQIAQEYGYAVHLMPQKYGHPAPIDSGLLVHRPTIERVLRVFLRYTGMRSSEVVTCSRGPLAGFLARVIICHHVIRLSGNGNGILTALGKFFKRHHSTIINSERVFKDEYRTNSDFRATAEMIKKALDDGES